MNARARPDLNPMRCVPPSFVSMLLTNVKMDSLFLSYDSTATEICTPSDCFAR